MVNGARKEGKLLLEKFSGITYSTPMKPIFHPHLVNGPLGDPLLYVDMKFFGRGILFDLGSCQALTSRNLLKISHIFVSHTHMDHFIGFDRLLRVLLGRPKSIALYGPRHFIDQVVHKISAYTWNLVENYDGMLEFWVHEVSPDRMERVCLRSVTGFKIEGAREVGPFDGILYEEGPFRVRGAFLDHKIPCLGFALEERFHIHVLKTELERWGFAKGPWLKGLKEAVWKGEPRDFLVPAVLITETGEETTFFPLGTLKDRILKITSGQKIAYIPDTVLNGETEKTIMSLAENADSLFIETPFMASDRERAEKKYHLTAEQAGILAAKAGVKRLFPFHISPKYSTHPEKVMEEAQAAFRRLTEEKKGSK